MKTKLLLPPPVYFIISLIGIVIFGFIYPLLKIIPYPYSLLGSLLIIVGIIFMGSAGRLFRKFKTTIDPNKKSTKLVINDPYGFSRNPMYLGASLALIGVSIISRSLISLFSSFLAPILINFLVIPFEEEMLKKTFGKEFNKYKMKVRRWI